MIIRFLILFIMIVVGDNRVFSDTLLSTPGKYSILWRFNDSAGNNITFPQTVNITRGIKIFTWTQTEIDTNRYGYYSNLSLKPKTENDSLLQYSAELNILRCPWWADPTNVYISIYKNKPTIIKRCSKRFDSIPWLKNITGSFHDTLYTFRFNFPMLPDGVKYVPYDYFSIKYNDTMSMEFCFINDSVAIGSMISDTGRTKIYARDALGILTTNSLFRVKAFQIKGEFKTLMSSFLSINLNTFKTDAKYYGIEIF